MAKKNIINEGASEDLNFNVQSMRLDEADTKTLISMNDSLRKYKNNESIESML
jgi:hypothetical protein